MSECCAWLLPHLILIFYSRQQYWFDNKTTRSLLRYLHRTPQSSRRMKLIHIFYLPFNKIISFQGRNEIWTKENHEPIGIYSPYKGTAGEFTHSFRIQSTVQTSTRPSCLHTQVDNHSLLLNISKFIHSSRINITRFRNKVLSHGHVWMLIYILKELKDQRGE